MDDKVGEVDTRDRSVAGLPRGGTGDSAAALRTSSTVRKLSSTILYKAGKLL